MTDTPETAGSGDAILPLAGLVVLDVSTFIAAPAAAVVLGDFGADVIKVEAAEGGDPNRVSVGIASYPPSETNYPWILGSRNTRSIAIDLRHAQGRAAFDRLRARADLRIVTLPPAVRARLKLAYADVKRANARLIYASLTGYGETGADRDRPGFDATAYFARSGLIDAATYEGAPPAFSLPAQGDRATAMSIVSGVLLALLHRERTGRGGEVTTSLVANGVWSNGIMVQAALAGAYLAPRPPRTRPRSALTNPYLCADGRWFQLTIVREDVMWAPLCAATGRPDLEKDPRFATTSERRRNAVALTAEFDAVFATRPWAEWRAILARHGLVFGEIARLADVIEDRQLAETGVLVPSGDPGVERTIASPFWTDFAARRPAGPAPSLGQHTDEILRWTGMSDAEIAALRQAGAVR